MTQMGPQHTASDIWLSPDGEKKLDEASANVPPGSWNMTGASQVQGLKTVKRATI